MQVAGCGLKVIIKSRLHFLFFHVVDLTHGEFLLVKLLYGYCDIH